jgi:hypothetical protein
MSLNLCRLCNSQNTKLTSTISDEIVTKFLELVPSLNLNSNAKFPSKVCQLCFGKAKITCDFIDKIQKVQKDIEKTFKKSPRKSISTATEDALRKVQRVGIKVTKVQVDKPKFEFINDDGEFVDEESFDGLQGDDEDCVIEDEAIEVTLSDDDDFKPQEEMSEDSEEEFKPRASRAGQRRSGGGAKGSIAKKVKKLKKNLFKKFKNIFK